MSDTPPLTTEEWRKSPESVRNKPKLSEEENERIVNEAIAGGQKWDVYERLNEYKEFRAGVFAEINDLKDTAKAFGIDAITDGSWFNEFLSSCLKGYHERVMKQGGEAYLRNKYPGRPTHTVARELCQLAEQAAMMAEQHAWHT